MGGWRLEAFKMALYMAFPVGVFWWFNQPQFFEKWMMDKRKELFPAEDPVVRQQIKERVKEMELKRQEELEAELKKLNR